jgi:hypothetical protein
MTMRSQTKVFLFGLFMIIGLTWVSEASAFIPAGGSRLLFYFSKKSFAAGAANDTAQTLVFVSNANNSSASRVGIKYYRSDCQQEIGPVFQNIAAGQTLRIDVAAQAPTFQEGIVEAFFVNGANQPIRNDFGAGSSIIIDLNLAQVVRLPAALLYSDDRTSSGVIASNTNTTTWAPLLLTGNFADPSIVTTRIAMFAPGNASGTASANQLVAVDFRREDGGGAVTGPLNIMCGRSLTLAQVRGQTPAQFQSSFPAGGLLVPQVNGQEKGIVGWLIEVIQLTGVTDIIFGQLMQGLGTASLSSHP